MTDAEVTGSPAARPVTGALGGSQLLAQPRYAGEVEAWHRALAAPRVLVEVGFDHGFRLAATAADHPDWQVVGMEVRKQRVAAAAERAEAHGRNNLLAWRVDARIVFAGYTPAHRIDVVEVLFPTPWWHPGRRARRLLLTPEFVADVARALKPGGVLLIETDVAMTAEAIEMALSQTARLVPDDTAWAARPPIEAVSRRQWKCAREGLPTWRFGLRARGEHSEPAPAEESSPC